VAFHPQAEHSSNAHHPVAALPGGGVAIQRSQGLPATPDRLLAEVAAEVFGEPAGRPRDTVGLGNRVGMQETDGTILDGDEGRKTASLFQHP